MRTALSPGAARAMRFVQLYLAANDGRAPTLQAIADGLHLASKSSAHRMLSELQECGFITRTHNKTRAIEIVRVLPDDRFEQAAKAVCDALGASGKDMIDKARRAIVAVLVEGAA